MLGIIDIGISNIASVGNALSYLKIPFKFMRTIDDFTDVSGVILPGVGSFRVAMKKLESTGFKQVIQTSAEKNLPILGICLGMQLLATTGTEGGASEGLGLIKGSILPIRHRIKGIRIPHMGWNDITTNNCSLMEKSNIDDCYYFVHSYEMILDDPDVISEHTNDEFDIVSVVEKGHIFGTQFHPEKSQHAGLNILKVFYEKSC